MDIVIRGANTQEEAEIAIKAIYKSKDELNQNRIDAVKGKKGFISPQRGRGPLNGHLYQFKDYQMNVYVTYAETYVAKIIRTQKVVEMRTL